VASRDTLDTDYAQHRQRFLAEQGYTYRIVDADDLLGPTVPEAADRWTRVSHPGVAAARCRWCAPC
jgi:hypothetical protein